MNQFLNKQRRIGVLRGGGGGFHARSLEEGGNFITYVIENLYPKWKPVDIYVDENEVWHVSGLPVLPTLLPQKVDVVWNTIPAKYNQLLNDLNLPQVGQSAFASLLTNNKEAFSNFANQNNIQTLRKVVFPVYQADFDGNQEEYILTKAREVWKKFSPPWVVRAYNTDRNVGMRVAKTFPDLITAITEMVLHGDSILVEELVLGKAVSTHSVPGFRGEDLYHFPTSSPQGLTKEEKEDLLDTAQKIQQSIGGHYLKADFVINPRTGIHLVDFSLKPDYRDNSHFDDACKSVGTRTSHIISHIFDGVL
ncbi:MAG: hypothetical protein KGZ39_04895 [Simkania sp.]|nr:hypothetical protein [Simkania sp.]